MRATLLACGLAAAGFEVRLADPAKRQAMLARLPADHVAMRDVNGETVYLYPDPTACHCVSSGGAAAFSKHQPLGAKDNALVLGAGGELDVPLPMASLRRDRHRQFCAWGRRPGRRSAQQPRARRCKADAELVGRSRTACPGGG